VKPVPLHRSFLLPGLFDILRTAPVVEIHGVKSICWPRRGRVGELLTPAVELNELLFYNRFDFRINSLAYILFVNFEARIELNGLLFLI
jgi:hypothetical protein